MRDKRSTYNCHQKRKKVTSQKRLQPKKKKKDIKNTYKLIDMTSKLTNVENLNTLYPFENVNAPSNKSQKLTLGLVGFVRKF